MNLGQSVTKKQTSPSLLGKERNYNDIVAYLNAHWDANTPSSKTIERMQKLDQAFDTVSQKVDTILVTGSNGKSLTCHFASKLLQAEGLNVGILYSPHILTYNERFTINQTTITNKVFTDLANTVINTAESLGLEATTSEILTMMGLLYFAENKVDVALLEVGSGTHYDATNVCHAKVATITRATATSIDTDARTVTAHIDSMMDIVKAGTWVVAGDQNKLHLQIMEKTALSRGGNWAMPIRKLAALPYPFEQLHGRCGALAERISWLYIKNFREKPAEEVVVDTLLVRQKGQRGRPTIEAKKRSLENPKPSLEQFWNITTNTLAGRFQLLDKEKTTILLDNANNLDAFNNLLLGIRLLHYQRPLKGLTIIVGAAHNTLHNEEFLKLLRYFFKKTTGQLFVCPLNEPLPGNHEENSWNAEQVANDFKTMKIKAQAFKSFDEAFEAAKGSVDERYGLVVITGSQSILNSYWLNKGIKKLC